MSDNETIAQTILTKIDEATAPAAMPDPSIALEVLEEIIEGLRMRCDALAEDIGRNQESAP